jgi:hypothetical protein
MIMDKPVEVKSEKDHEAEHAADTLLRAHEIKADKELMERVKKHAGKKLKALKGFKKDIRSMADLKAVRNELIAKKSKEMLGEDSDDDSDED